jgi:serine/threonine-protein kinase HipA
MSDFEVHIDLDGRTRHVGLARTNLVRGTETILFEYDGAWLADPDRFSLEPALALTRGAFAPPAGRATFGAIGDSAPDTWGRRLMQRAERRLAEREGRAVRTLGESDYLLGVADETRLGALRFRRPREDVFQAPVRAGVPALIELGRLLQITERIFRDEETDEDLQLIFAPGSSLGGARPKDRRCPGATWRAGEDRRACALSARRLQRHDLQCRRPPAQPRFSLARQGRLVAVPGL